jgi:dihydroxyacetone kinase DhaKLM complex PTS-EIIA-like component DhaM
MIAPMVWTAAMHMGTVSHSALPSSGVQRVLRASKMKEEPVEEIRTVVQGTVGTHRLRVLATAMRIVLVMETVVLMFVNSALS